MLKFIAIVAFILVLILPGVDDKAHVTFAAITTVLICAMFVYVPPLVLFLIFLGIFAFCTMTPIVIDTIYCIKARRKREEKARIRRLIRQRRIDAKAQMRAFELIMKATTEAYGIKRTPKEPKFEDWDDYHGINIKELKKGRQ